MHKIAVSGLECIEVKLFAEIYIANNKYSLCDFRDIYKNTQMTRISFIPYGL